MNVIIAVLLCFALLGIIDKIFGNRMGLAEEFDRGLNSMGPLVLSLSGIYCLGITLVQNNTDVFAQLAQILPFDPSIIIGSLLAPDLGGFAIAGQLAADSSIGTFSGVVISSTLGCTISFILPISLSLLPRQEIKFFMQGILWGIITIPVGLIVAAPILGLKFFQFWNCLWPVLIICIFLYLAISKFPSGSIRVLSGIGNLIRILSIILFAVTAAAAYLPGLSIVSQELILESLMIAFKITIVVCGSMVACRIAMRKCKPLLSKLAQKLHINEYAVIGLLGSLATNIAMLPFYDAMDPKGKAMNAAFSVSGAFVFGGQLAFISSVTTQTAVIAFILSKLIAGITAVIAAAVFTRFTPTDAVKS